MRSRTIGLVLLAVLLAAALPAHAGEGAGDWSDEILDLASIVPIQDGGRVKPLSTYARYSLLSLSGYTSYSRDESGKISAMGWLLDCLFFPEKARGYEVVLVPDSDLLEAVGLKDEARKKRDRYSYNQLVGGRMNIASAARRAFAKDQRGEELETKEEQSIQLHHNLTTLEQLYDYLDFARRREGRFPMRATPGLEAIFKDTEEQRASTILRRARALGAALAVAKQSGAKEEESALLRLHATVRGAMQGTDGLALIPPAASVDQIDRWLTPWVLYANSFGQAATGRPMVPFGAEYDLLEKLEDLEAGKDDPDRFRTALKAFRKTAAGLAEARGEGRNVELEADFYSLDPFTWSKWLFVLGFILVAVSWMVPPNRWLGLAIWVFLGAALTFLVGGIVVRCLIRERPPVTTLYETMLFITAVFVLLALIIEFLFKRRIAIASAAILGAIGMFAADRYDFGKGQDTMQVLMAVLDTNFWLWTHVTTISIGYAAGLLAAVIAHVYVFGKLFNLKAGDPEFYRGVGRTVYGVTCFGLLFSVVGTLLGGIWANDSWGRFWGWDPKENGALLICLWMTAMIHARLGGRYIKDLGLSLAAIFGGLVVVFSWFGVNLLGVGLHSYGFTSGILSILLIIGGVEMAVIGIGVYVWSLQRRPLDAEMVE